MASTASAFISFPNPSCPDSVTINQIWAGGACKPTAGAATVGDTVMGVSGVITCFDVRPTTFGFYMQNHGNPAEQIGMDVYCGSRNYNAAPYNWALGDSVSVTWGGVEDFNGSKEVVGPNNVTNTNIIIVKKGTSTLITPNILTTSQLKWSTTNTASDKWLCTLVRVNGPLYVRRTSGNNAYLVSPSATSDTLQVFGAKFIATGTVIGSSVPNGTLVNFVQGIYENGGGTFSYELLPRDANDLSIAAPPNVSDMYLTDDTHVRILFDKALDVTSATDVSNYTTLSGASVDVAAMDGTQNVILTLSGVLSHGQSETITVSGIKNTQTPQDVMLSPQSRTFVSGVLSVAEVSAPNPDSLLATPCVDRSRFAGPAGQISLGLVGPRLSMQGVVTGILNNTYYMEDAAPSLAGNHGGITLFGVASPLTQGHQYVTAGAVQEYFGETEFSSPIYVSDLGAVTLPAPVPVTVAIVNLEACNVVSPANAEQFESMLVKLSTVKRIIRYDYATKPVNGFHVVGPNPTFADTCFIMNYGSALGTPDSNNVNYPAANTYVNVTGEVHYDGVNGFRVCPRNAADIQIIGPAGVLPTAPRELSLAVSNPASRPALSFVLPTATAVNLSVYDVSGRMIVNLVKGNLPAASYTRTWDGRDSNGHRAGAGVYFYRLTAGSQTRSTRGIMLGN